MGRSILMLLCLWSCVVAVTPLTDTQVYKATTYIKKNFKLAGAKQHAFVALLTKEECNSLSLNNIELKILPNENLKDIAAALKDSKKIYEGRQMVLATFHEESKTNKIHSEYRLLFPPSGQGVSPAKNLLNKNKDKAACAFFYTLNSPCVGRCANPKSPKNIIEELSVFQNFNNNKAFVYDKLFKGDLESPKKTEDDIWAGLTQMNEKMAVYRCTATTCFQCFQNIGNQLGNKKECLKK